ncbi:MAG TPA: tyrosine-type recombinase/integrase [Ktedonosporobacter sp.]|nr:tyrosine-type recombinase/integrase [Ktedonosporobacter sp.]
MPMPIFYAPPHATELIKAGWDACYVQKRLGHAQVQTTINTYVHLDDEDLSQKWRAYQQEKQRGSSPPLSNE